MITCDVLVLGAGIAGCVAAIRAADLGADVVLVAKDTLGMTNTSWAQGGIIGLPGEAEHDSPSLLAADIEAAGAGLCRHEAVHLLAEEGPQLCRDFLWSRLGVPFDQNVEGDPDPTKEAAHSAKRIYHAKDATGLAIQRTLNQAVSQHPRIRVLENRMLVDLLTLPHHAADPLQVYDPLHVWGAYLFNEADGVVTTVVAKRTVLATGGLGYLYQHTTNPSSATGDGLAAAYRATARIVNCEYIQFHPTALYVPGKPRMLLTEALRGEGAHLVNRKGERFMQKYAPEQMELAPRDVVSRSIFQELATSGEASVYLDLRPLKAKLDIEEHFPTVYAACVAEGLDPLRQPIPVVPAAHYFCGGVLVDLDGRTSLPGLYAAGEVACTGLHGANRLASTSLLEGLLWGHRAADAIAAELPRIMAPEAQQFAAWQPPMNSMESMGSEEPDPLLVDQDWSLIRTTLWNYAGIIRSGARLERGRADMGYLYHRIERFYREAPLSRKILELRSAIICARLILKAALLNRESRGCHYRVD